MILSKPFLGDYHKKCTLNACCGPILAVDFIHDPEHFRYCWIGFRERFLGFALFENNR